MELRVNRGGPDSEHLYQSLRGRILDGSYALGSRLPAETSLCSEFGLSRPVVRETLARLRVEGLIESRQGAGTFVRSIDGERRRSSNGFEPVRNLADVRQCFDFRAALEGEAAYHAALGRSEADLAELRERAVAFDAITATARMGDDEDFAFHLLVAKAGGITFFESVIASMRHHIMVGMKLAGDLAGGDVRERLAAVRAEHRAVVDAIACTDADAAREAMRKHIDNSRKRLFG
jgi:GntR family transcriptional regulator, transcriptional repressor for pyruvate dehydrogenase complex